MDGKVVVATNHGDVLDDEWASQLVGSGAIVPYAGQVEGHFVVEGVPLPLEHKTKRKAPSHDLEVQRLAKRAQRAAKKKEGEDLVARNAKLEAENATLRDQLQAKIDEIESLNGKPERAALAFYKSRGGVAPVLVISRYDGKEGGYKHYNESLRRYFDEHYASTVEARRWNTMASQSEVDHTLVKGEKARKGSATKSAKHEVIETPTEAVVFGDDMQEVGEGVRVYWIPKAMDAWKKHPLLARYVEFVHDSLPGYFARRTGKYGRGVSILDTGNPFMPFDVPCPRTRSHRDYDKHRCNSMTVILFLQRDCLIFPYLGGEYKLVANAGDMCMFPTSVFHQGASMEDLYGSLLGPSRRRVFLYLDWQTTVVDSLGQVVTEKELGGLPKDYDLSVYEVSSLKAGYYLLSSPFLDGRVYQTENLFASNMKTQTPK